MSLRWLEGFEMESFLTHAQRKYATVTNGWGNSNPGRTNSNHRSISDIDMILITPALVGVLGNTWTVGFGYLMDDAPTAPGSVTRAPGIRLLDGPSETADEQISIEVQPEVVLSSEVARAVITVRRGATVVATGTKKILHNRWYYIEAQVVVRTGVNGSVMVKVYDQSNNTLTTDINVSGINTANQGTDGADRAAFIWDSVGTTSDDVRFDDIYVADDTTFRASNGFVIEGLETQVGDGDLAQWELQGGATSVGHALLDSQTTVTSTFEDRRIVSDTVGQISLAPYADLAWIKDGVIAGVFVITLARMETSGTRTIANLFRHKNPGPTNFTGASQVISDTAFDSFVEAFQNNPVTAVPWTVADINLGQWGVTVVA